MRAYEDMEGCFLLNQQFADLDCLAAGIIRINNASCRFGEASVEWGMVGNSTSSGMDNRVWERSV